ncbi:T9SS type A sorting domain-containing protein [Mariniflexile sp. AS56]|uniref:T9SS type A sorting domain-containing protein n=1 Tax=Mariniflexile sp. AS56 TaxID=3063957 RepID=UPI0026F17B15|nr:T9SS type A sorting domain-containing protein [Mariniflexile sp. AS56]MDO7172092.1 T9SS type A sorting domain-containing protein [Mariniflexile sp. AS56]
MKYLITLSLGIIGIWSASGQIKNATEKFPLPTILNESSGAIFFNGKVITHNDSGGENKLYELDTISGNVTREVVISNATNLDWEDITHDDTSIYIGDIGNNVSGNRTDLKIYKINKSDYTNQTSVHAETIAFSYSNQTDFTSNPNNTEWDAEALVSFDASNLILFSKNWVNGSSLAYVVPKTPGTYTLSPLATTLASGGLITGGTYNIFSGKLYLVGYSEALEPFVWVSENFTGNDIFSGTNTQIMLSSFGFEQAEAITFVNENRYFITSESFSKSFGSFTIADHAKLISFSTNDTRLSLNKINEAEAILLYPNPVINYLTIKNAAVNKVEIYDAKLTQLYTGTNKIIDMEHFSKGIYIVKMMSNQGELAIKKVVKK